MITRYLCIFHLMDFLNSKSFRSTVFASNRYKKYTIQGLDPKRQIPKCLNARCIKRAEFEVEWEEWADEVKKIHNKNKEKKLVNN